MKGYISNRYSMGLEIAGLLLALGAGTKARGEGVEAGFYTFDDSPAVRKVTAPDADVERFRKVLGMTVDANPVTQGVLSPEEIDQVKLENGRRVVSNNLYQKILNDFRVRENPVATEVSAKEVEKVYDREIALMQDPQRKTLLQEQKDQVTKWVNAGKPGPVAVDDLEANTVYERPVNYVAVGSREWNDLKTLDSQIKALIDKSMNLFVPGDGKDKKDSFDVSQKVLDELAQRGAAIPAGISAGQYLDASARPIVEKAEAVFDGMTQHYILEAALEGKDTTQEKVGPGMVVHLSPKSALEYNAKRKDETAPRVRPGDFRLVPANIPEEQRGWYTMADTIPPKGFIEPYEQRLWFEALKLGGAGQKAEPRKKQKEEHKGMRQLHDDKANQKSRRK